MASSWQGWSKSQRRDRVRQVLLPGSQQPRGSLTPGSMCPTHSSSPGQKPPDFEAHSGSGAGRLEKMAALFLPQTHIEGCFHSKGLCSTSITPRLLSSVYARLHGGLDVEAKHLAVLQTAHVPLEDMQQAGQHLSLEAIWFLSPPQLCEKVLHADDADLGEAFSFKPVVTTDEVVFVIVSRGVVGAAIGDVVACKCHNLVYACCGGPANFGTRPAGSPGSSSCESQKGKYARFMSNSCFLAWKDSH
mmetsp:Transcript_7494/g.17114  ORF Transcript_7494/g.17114 Transcript_7494/m.17114 type:complete len:246 (+) Transcript_7494:940-1677(+)